MNLVKILAVVERMLGFDFPKPVSEEQHSRRQKTAVKRIVSHLSRGNLSLQNGRYIMPEDIEALRHKNQQHDFCS